MLIRRTSLTSHRCDGKAMSSAANDKFGLGSLDPSTPREGDTRSSLHEGAWEISPMVAEKE